MICACSLCYALSPNAMCMFFMLCACSVCYAPVPCDMRLFRVLCACSVCYAPVPYVWHAPCSYAMRVYRILNAHPWCFSVVLRVYARLCYVVHYVSNAICLLLLLQLERMFTKTHYERSINVASINTIPDRYHSVITSYILPTREEWT